MNATATPLECPFCGSAAFPDCCFIAQHEYKLHAAAERQKLARVRALLPLVDESRRLSVDFIARLADAWDGRGNHVFRASGVEHRALLELAQLPKELAGVRWSQLSGEQRHALVFATRAVIHLARECVWLFGG